MSYLFGDSSEANLDFNYLAFLREVIECAAVLVECEATISASNERKRAKETEAAQLIASIDALGKRAAEQVAPMAKDKTAVGRCAASIAAAIRDSVDRETAQVKSELAAEQAEMAEGDQRLRSRAREVLGKLLREHDLPGAVTELEVTWAGSAVKATLRQKTTFGVEAVLSLEVPASSMFTADLRVDRVAEGVEVHTHEAGGWLKKSDKLVTLKLGRYLVTGVFLGVDVAVRLRSAADATAPGLIVTAHRNGDVSVVSSGGPEREVVVEERDRPALRLLAARLEAAAQALEENRTGLVTVEIDGKSIAEHEHPRVLAERLILAIAPTVKKIAKHSRSPGELVLRRLLGDNRREEIFVSTAELLKRVEPLAAESRSVFAPLELGDPASRTKTPTAPLAGAPLVSPAAPKTRSPTAPPATSRPPTDPVAAEPAPPVGVDADGDGSASSSKT